MAKGKAAIGPAITQLLESVLDGDLDDPEQAIAHCAVFLILSGKYSISLQTMIVEQAKLYSGLVLFQRAAAAAAAPEPEPPFTVTGPAGTISESPLEDLPDIPDEELPPDEELDVLDQLGQSLLPQDETPEE